MKYFKKERLENVPNNLKTLLQESKRDIERLIEVEKKTYISVVEPYQVISEKISEYLTPIFHLDSVENCEKTQTVYGKCLPLISEYSSWLGQNEELFKVFKGIPTEDLNYEQKKVLENEIRDFSLSGCGLSGGNKKRLKEISLELSELSKKFTQNVLDATNDFEMIIQNKTDVKEIPESELKQAQFEEDGVTKWRFTLQMPSYIAYITYGTSREKREEIYKAYSSRAPKNEEVINKILKLKEEKVKILGFDNYAQYSLSTKMASNEEEVISFLTQLGKEAKSSAQTELKQIEEYALQEDNIIELKSYDVAYYSDKLKKEQYSINEEKYRPYFEQNSVLEGLFIFLNKLLKIEFKDVTNENETWNEKVKVYDIYEGDKKISRLYMDLEARKNKSGGAWMNNWHTRYNIQGTENNASAYVVCNFPPSTEKEPSLLRHGDVVTLFHEMGHAIHHLLSKVSESSISGVNGVAWDVVEFPSQFLEYFAYDKEVLKMFAKHYEKKEVLSDKMIEKLIKSKNFQSSLMTVRQVEFALFDFKLHQKLYQGNEVQELLNEVRKEFSVIKPPKYNKFQNSFSHIFGGGYAAGYYSYKWAEVLSADAYYLFMEKGRFNEDLTSKYKEYILGKGGSIDMNELYFQLTGRKPNVKSLLKMDGIIEL